MFDEDTWRRQIGERLGEFARNPRMEMQLAGTQSLFAYLVSHTLHPFLEAFHTEPINAVLALSLISRSSGADYIVRSAARMRYQSSLHIERELRSCKELRVAAEQFMIELQTIPQARQRLNSSREEWLTEMIERDIDAFPGEFSQLRRVLRDTSGQVRIDMLRRLKNRGGRYTAGDLAILQDGLRDSSAHVRSAAVRLIGMMTGEPPQVLVSMLVKVALHDSDAETRFASARAIGMLRDYVISPQLLDQLSLNLIDHDRFLRTAAALVLGQLGEMASAPLLIRNLTRLLQDTDVYAREAAARALGRIGFAAATPEVLAALTRTTQDLDVQVHEAATESLIQLRDLRPITLELMVPA